MSHSKPTDLPTLADLGLSPRWRAVDDAEWCRLYAERMAEHGYTVRF